MITSSKATSEAEAVLICAKADCLFAVLFFYLVMLMGRKGRGKGEGMSLFQADGWAVIIPGCICFREYVLYSKLQEVWTCAAA